MEQSSTTNRTIQTIDEIIAIISTEETIESSSSGEEETIESSSSKKNNHSDFYILDNLIKEMTIEK